jgi:hypothetical protein
LDGVLGWFFFPEVKGGKGKANDIFASVDGWLVSKDAPQRDGGFHESMARERILQQLTS